MPKPDAYRTDLKRPPFNNSGNRGFGGGGGSNTSPREATRNFDEIEREVKNVKNKGEEEIAKFLVNKNLTTTQIRKFLSAINKLENKANSKRGEFSETELKEIHFLNVKLAYQAGREKEKETALKSFYFLLKDKIAAVKNRKEFENFARYMEAVVAYHKFYGGKD